VIPNPIFDRLLAMIGRVLSRTTNPVAVAGHLAAGDTGPGDAWSISTGRAQLSRELLEAAGVRDARMERVSGKADRNPVEADARDPRNRRVEITLLRKFKGAD
jgi:chemotaxis protein MotB